MFMHSKFILCIDIYPDYIINNLSVLALTHFRNSVLKKKDADYHKRDKTGNKTVHNYT